MTFYIVKIKDATFLYFHFFVVKLNFASIFLKLEKATKHYFLIPVSKKYKQKQKVKSKIRHQTDPELLYIL